MQQRRLRGLRVPGFLLVVLVVLGSIIALSVRSEDQRSDMGLSAEVTRPPPESPILSASDVGARKFAGMNLATVRLKVLVTAPDGTSAEARVHYRRAGADDAIASATEGHCELVLTLASDCTLEVQAESPDGLAWSQTKVISLTAGAEQEVSLALRGRRIRGRVVDNRTGAPVSNASIYFGVRSKRRRETGKTDVNGTFDFVLEYGTAGKAIDIYHALYEPGAMLATTESELTEVRLTPRARLHGVVRFEDGRPAVGAQIQLLVLSPRSAAPPERRDDDPWQTGQGWIVSGMRDDPNSAHVRVDLTRVADAAGRFSTALPFHGGRVSVSVSLPGYATSSVPLAAPESDQPLEVILRPSRMKGGRLRLLRKDGTPIRGVLVWVQERAQGLEQRTFLRAKSDKDGYIDTASLTEGQETLITLTPDPDDPQCDEFPRPHYPFKWTVRHTDTVVVRPGN